MIYDTSLPENRLVGIPRYEKFVEWLTGKSVERSLSGNNLLVEPLRRLSEERSTEPGTVQYFGIPLGTEEKLYVSRYKTMTGNILFYKEEKLYTSAAELSCRDSCVVKLNNIKDFIVVKYYLSENPWCEKILDKANPPYFPPGSIANSHRTLRIKGGALILGDKLATPIGMLTVKTNNIDISKEHTLAKLLRSAGVDIRGSSSLSREGLNNRSLQVKLIQRHFTADCR